jgi:polysaccharide pyruvyl transferase WcaK-like protein
MRESLRLLDLIGRNDFSNSLLVGYYGGGNYGDELLLEILQNIFSKKGYTHIQIAYQDPANFAMRHKNFGYPPIDIHKPQSVIRASLKARNIIIGGGGLWGVDINATTFLLGPYLFFARHILRKKVYLLGVGFYNSTNRYGRISAWFAAHAANWIIGRDEETVVNFTSHTKNVSYDVDMAWYAADINHDLYRSEVNKLDKQLKVKSKTVVVTLRRFRHKNEYASLIEKFLLNNRQHNVIVMALESEQGDPESHSLINKLRQERPDYQYFTEPTNPMALFLFFARHHKRLRLIGPQFHIIITAHINGVSFLPLVYDNKVDALLEHIGIPVDERIMINQVRRTDITDFLKLEET